MMGTTVFSTPLVTPLLRLLAIGVLKITGWKAVGPEGGPRPDGDDSPAPRYVLIGAPHTSNWDFPIMLLVVLKLRLKIYWMGKNSLFSFPFGFLMKWLGGIPIDRSRANRVVDQTVRQYQETPELVVLIPPEGTRSQVKRWKTGFYHIAHKAEIPILMGYIDASKKESGLADFYYPSGDIEADMVEIRRFYATKTGINPQNAGD